MILPSFCLADSALKIRKSKKPPKKTMNTSHAFVPLNVHKHRFPCWDNNIIWIVRSHSHEKKTNLAFHIVFQDFHTWYKPALASVTVGGGSIDFTLTLLLPSVALTILFSVCLSQINKKETVFLYFSAPLSKCVGVLHMNKPSFIKVWMCCKT